MRVFVCSISLTHIRTESDCVTDFFPADSSRFAKTVCELCVVLFSDARWISSDRRLKCFMHDCSYLSGNFGGRWVGFFWCFPEALSWKPDLHTAPTSLSTQTTFTLLLQESNFSIMCFHIWSNLEKTQGEWSYIYYWWRSEQIAHLRKKLHFIAWCGFQHMVLNSLYE